MVFQRPFILIQPLQKFLERIKQSAHAVNLGPYRKLSTNIRSVSAWIART
jgi:hypothetical protein